ncbi:MAG: PAS domain-containing protein [Bacteroidetes bacterium]|nr:PAS domain-containing protein [Bacteroidota bacterium]
MNEKKINISPADGNFSLFRYITVKYIFVVIALVTAGGMLFYYAGKKYLIGSAERYSVAIAKNLNHELYQHFFLPYQKTPETYNLKDSTQFKILDEIAGRFLEHLQVTKINIFNRQTVLIYSTDPEIIGESTPKNLKLLRALQGELVSSLELAHEEPDIVYDTHPVDFLETYIPLRKMSSDLKYEGEIVGSFEIYQDVTVIYSQITSLRDLVILFSLLIIIAHIGIVSFITRRGDKFLTKERKLKEQLELSIRTKLEEMVKERTRELEEEKNKLQVILDSVPSALILLDRNLCIQSVSAAYSTITRNPLTNIHGKICTLCTEYGTSPQQCPSRRALISGHIENHLVEIENGNICFEHTAVPIKHNGQIDSILEIITDITERKRLQDQMVRAEKATAVGELAAVIAHEVRNSLTSIKLILQYFTESDKLKNRKEKESIRVAMSSLYRLEGIVNELLNFARPQEMQFSMQDVNQIVMESVIFSRHQFERKRISLVEDLTPNLSRLTIDAASIKEVIINLLLNATHAVTEGNGIVKIKTAPLILPETLRVSLTEYHLFPKIGNYIELKQGEKVITIEISDNGCGITPVNLARIFDPFFTTKTDGTGLGLTLAKRVVSEHGGVILVKSQEGKGSTFTILLPIRGTVK